MTTVLVNGADTTLGRRVVELVRSAPDAPVVVPVDDAATATSVPVAAVDGELDLVVLAPRPGPDRDGSSVGGVDLDAAAALLATTSRLPVRSVVVLSSAMTYGAWPDNPIPLTEDAVLRPNPGCRYAADKAELERACVEWAAERSIPVAVLRPALTLSTDAAGTEWLESSLWHVPTARHGEADPPGQFLAAEDLARAVEHARRARLDGAFNVAPDGWLAADRQIELSGRGGWLRIPVSAVGAVASLRWRWRLTSTPPDVVPYTMHPWVVANDRLRATGWAPAYSNDETFVAATREGWWASLNARHRQDVALGGMVAGAALVAGGIAWAIRARRRRS